jgi:hypothetical protein
MDVFLKSFRAKIGPALAWLATGKGQSPTFSQGKQCKKPLYRSSLKPQNGFL